jgi:hypothetical protein
MLDSLLGAAGVLVSILLFLIGHRQTVGGKKERIRSSNVDEVFSCSRSAETLNARIESNSPSALSRFAVVRFLSESYVPSDPSKPIDRMPDCEIIGNAWVFLVCVTAGARFVISRSPVWGGGPKLPNRRKRLDENKGNDIHVFLLRVQGQKKRVAKGSPSLARLSVDSLLRLSLAPARRLRAKPSPQVRPHGHLLMIHSPNR